MAKSMNWILVLLLLVSTAGAKQVFDRTELIDLGKEVARTIKQAEEKVKPQLENEKRASSELRANLKKFKQAKSPDERALFWSEVEVSCAEMLKGTIDALETLDNAVTSLTDSLIKINDSLLQGGEQQSRMVEQINRQMDAKMEELSNITQMTANITMKYITDPRVKAMVSKSLNNIKQRSINGRQMQKRVKSVRKVARKRILGAMEMQTELSNLLKMYNDEALWRSFLAKLQLVGVVMNEAERSLHLDDVGNAFVSHVDSLKNNMADLEEVRYLDEMNNYNIFEDAVDKPAFGYDSSSVDDDLLEFGRQGLKDKEDIGGE